MSSRYIYIHICSREACTHRARRRARLRSRRTAVVVVVTQSRDTITGWEETEDVFFALAAAEDDRDGGENVEEVDDRTFIDSFDRDGSARDEFIASLVIDEPFTGEFFEQEEWCASEETQREIEAQTIEDVNGFHSPWSQYEFRVEEDDDDDTTPWEEHMKEVMGEESELAVLGFYEAGGGVRTGTRVCVVSETSRQIRCVRGEGAVV